MRETWGLSRRRVHCSKFSKNWKKCFYFLRISWTHAIYFDHGLPPPSTPPRSMPPPLPTQLFVFFLLLKPLKPNLCFLYSLWCAAFHWRVVYLLEPLSLEKTDPPPQPGPISHQWLLIQACELFHVGILSVLCMLSQSLWVNICNFSPVSRKLFPCSHLPPLALKIFLAPLLQWSLSLGRKGCNISVPFMSEHPTVSYSLYLDQKWILRYLQYTA